MFRLLASGEQAVQRRRYSICHRKQTVWISASEKTMSSASERSRPSTSVNSTCRWWDAYEVSALRHALAAECGRPITGALVLASPSPTGPEVILIPRHPAASTQDRRTVWRRSTMCSIQVVNCLTLIHYRRIRQFQLRRV